MRAGRTMGLLTLFAGLATWFATRAAMERSHQIRRREQEDRLRWETDGGATAGTTLPSRCRPSPDSRSWAGARATGRESSA